MPIRLLDTATAELIAAGEVVERPASVVKELAENAIDAGAQNITIEIAQGGIALIRITDDGCGIDEQEVQLAFLRHATSKVQTKDDLDSISTLGFRGEALASIASVAQVELVTKTAIADDACRYTMAGGIAGEVEAGAHPKGTTIIVRNLFFNTPARMKFLKKDASEGSFVTETVGRLALSHPKISFSYIRDGKKVFQTPGSGNLSAAAWEVLGGEFAKELLEVSYQEGAMRLSGLITPPRAARASRSMQFFFINSRFVKNRTIMAALEQAYKGMAMHGKFPGGILFLSMPPELVDVNVHPAKTEVRFAKEQEIFGLVYRAVKDTLQQQQAGYAPFVLGGEPLPAPDKQPLATITAFAKESAEVVLPQKPIEKPTQQKIPLPAVPLQYSESTLASSTQALPYISAKTQAGFIQPQRVPTGTAGTQLADARLDISAEDEPIQQQMPQPQGSAAVELQVVGEVFKTYIIAQRQNELCLIDKHAAHERLLYEKLAAQRIAPAVQLLLSPIVVALSAAEKNAVLQNEQALCSAGVELEDFGGNAVLVRGVPADIEPTDVELLVQEVAARLAVNERDTLNQKTEWVLHSIACRAAVKAGDKNTLQELVHLAQDILNGTVPPFCPHGRPVVLRITRAELEKQFGRLG